MKVDQASSAEFHFSDGQALEVRPCNGVWGGITPTGLVQANFYVDVVKMPTSVVFQRDPETGEAASPQLIGGPASDKAEYLRQFVSGLVMRPEDAMGIGQWLLTNAAEIIAMQGGGVEIDFNGQKVVFGIVPEKE